MGVKRIPPEKRGYLTAPEIHRLWDEREQKRIDTFISTFRRQKVVDFITAILFNCPGQIAVSQPFECLGYRDLLLLIDLDVTGQPTDIVIELEFSNDRVNWYKYSQDFWIDLRYEDTAGDLLECVEAPVLAPWVRVRLVSTGCEAGATFEMTVKGVFNG